MNPTNQSVWIKPQTPAQPTQPTQQTQLTQPSTGQGMFGTNNALQILLGLGAMGKGQYGTAWSILKPPKETAKEQELKLQKTKAQAFSTQMDSLLKDWKKMPALARLPLPGIERVSPERTKYETAKQLYNVQLILMWEDKRITDDQRRIFAGLFPSPLMTESAAKARIDMLKSVVNEYSDIISPYKQQQLPQETTGIEDLLNYGQ